MFVVPHKHVVWSQQNIISGSLKRMPGVNGEALLKVMVSPFPIPFVVGPLWQLAKRTNNMMAAFALELNALTFIQVYFKKSLNAIIISN